MARNQWCSLMNSLYGLGSFHWFIKFGMCSYIELHLACLGRVMFRLFGFLELESVIRMVCLVFVFGGNWSLSTDFSNMAYSVAIIATFASIGAVFSIMVGRFVSTACAWFVRFVGSMFWSSLRVLPVEWHLHDCAKFRVLRHRVLALWSVWVVRIW